MLRNLFTSVLTLWMTVCAGTSFAAIQPMDRIVAVVNEGIITQSQLDLELAGFKKNLSQNPNITMPSDEDLTKQMLDKLIMDEIQIQYANRTGIIIDDQTLDSMIADIAKHNNLSLEELRLALNEDGLDYKTFRDAIRRQQVINQLQQRDVVSEIKVSNTEVSQFLNSAEGQSLQGYEYKLSHILISLPEAPSPQDIQIAQAKAQEIMQKIEQGADFSKTAFSSSSGSSALSGGELGWRSLASMPTIFVDDVVTMDKNEIRGPIRSPSGFHIVKLLDKKKSQSENAIEKTRVRHILVKPNALLSDAEAKLKLEDFLREIEAGTDFAMLAKTHSEDLASSANGGELGWVTSDQLVGEFAEMMEKAPIGEVTKPFRSSFGWHILEVLDRKQENNINEVIKINAQNMIRSRKVEERLENWLRQMRDEAYVKVNISDFADDDA